ncbi:MAG TPA: hypothetical protein VKF36_19630 [Syntrophorhabdales bacterium]|nr:hypothetical protein [Syntrophorhabdales bacterium]
MKRHANFQRISGYVVIGLVSTILYQPVVAASLTEVPSPVKEAAMQLVQFCIEPKVGFNEAAVAALVDYVLSSKQNREYSLPKSQECTGVYHEFDTRITFPRFIEYSYNPLIPPVITKPSSVRYAAWASPRDESQKLPTSWVPVPPAGVPVVIHAIQRESDTPDLNSGVYHEYDLKRTLILLNHKGRQVLFSVSKQIDKSDVGKKGYILGDDSDWTYYYSGEPGSPRTGLGWVKSYIYDYFSVCVYVESSTAPSMVRAAVFQWLSAGWSGINFVKESHILRGLERFARDCKVVLESPRLPAPNQMISVYQQFSNTSASDLTKKYAALQQALRSKAFAMGKISKSALDEPVSYANTPREQMVSELMLEYLKISIGKAPLIKE